MGSPRSSLGRPSQLTGRCCGSHGPRLAHAYACHTSLPLDIQEYHFYTVDMTTEVRGQPPSFEVRKKLAEEGKPVLVSFSLGKDALATTLALMDAGVEVQLAHLYLIPGLQFVDDTINRLEDAWGLKIHQYPHPSLWRMLNALVYQPPERCSIIEAAKMPDVDYGDMWGLIKDDLGMPKSTWVADGVRAADSIVRRASLTRHGVMKSTTRKVSPIHDWLLDEVMSRIRAADLPLPYTDPKRGAKLPIDYAWFGRSFDGIDARFTKPLREHAPEDYQRILDWFPLADIDIFRHDMED